MTQTWFAFRAYNSQTFYGFGTKEEADRYTDTLNEGCEINVYSAYEMNADEAAEFGVYGRDDTFNLDDELAARL